MKKYSDDSDEVQSLIQAMKSSTGETKMELEEIVLDGDEPLHFHLTEAGKMEKLKKKLGIANGANAGNIHTKEKFSAKKSVLEKGIDGEVDAPNNNHYWFRIQLSQTGEVCVRLTTERNAGEEFGTTSRYLNDKCMIVMPSLLFSVTKGKKENFHIEAKAEARAIMRQAAGLIMQGVEGDAAWCPDERTLVFDDEGVARANKAVGAQNVVDARYSDSLELLSHLSFYRGGDDPFVCFPIDDYYYCYAEEEE